MTVQELIDILSAIEDKSKPVKIDNLMMKSKML